MDDEVLAQHMAAAVSRSELAVEALGQLMAALRGCKQLR